MSFHYAPFPYDSVTSIKPMMIEEAWEPEAVEVIEEPDDRKKEYCSKYECEPDIPDTPAKTRYEEIQELSELLIKKSRGFLEKASSLFDNRALECTKSGTIVIGMRKPGTGMWEHIYL